MAIVPTAVVLLGYPAGFQISLRDREWYQNYFFNRANGQAAFWGKQSDNDVIIDGQVFDWAFVNDPNPNLTNRTSVAQFGVSALQSDRGVNFAGFEVIVVVIGVSKYYPRYPEPGGTDGGSTWVQSTFRKHRAVVMRVGDRFDFVAHELGHALGLQHSFGSPLFQTPGEQAGGYGHPYCIMSAMAYGGLGGPFMPTSPLGGWPEYAHVGPSLNAVTALGLGWVDAHTYDLAGGIPTDFELRSRHWGGRNPTLPRQALEVRAADGRTYVVEFRENADWDAGQQTAALIVAQGKGSTADVAYPNSHSGTYLSLLRFPITLGSIGSAYLAPGFAIEVLDWSPGTHSARIRVTSGRLKRTFVQSSSKVELVQTAVLESGMSTWYPGEKLCVEGTFQYNKLSKTQAATFEMTYGLAVPPTTATWIVEGTTLSQPVQTVSVTKEVRVANAKLDAAVGIRTVTIHCNIQTLPTGSVLRLTNVPADESYDVAVTGTIRTAVGSATETFLEEFEGIEYDYGREFDRARLHCLTDLSDPASRYATYEVLVEPDLWRKIPKKRHQPLEQLAKILGRLRSRDDQTAYNLGVKELSTVIGVASAEVRVLPRSVAMSSALPQGHPAPPAQDLQSWSAPTDEELTSVLKPFDKPSIKFSSDAE